MVRIKRLNPTDAVLNYMSVSWLFEVNSNL